MFEFSISASSGMARAGILRTPHGDIQTPVFMPVGTQATVKGMSREKIYSIGSQIILSNTYHLYLRPGEDLIEEFGGLHSFMNIDLPILTDSGGFQVFSLGKEGGQTTQALSKVHEDGVAFRSYRDGSRHFFTPEKAMQIQQKLGADIIMAFDECAPGNSSWKYARGAMERTHRWAVRCIAEHEKLQVERGNVGKNPQALFPIVQGVIYDDLRRESARFIGSLPTPGIAVGGLSVGESKADMLRILDVVAPELPPQKPHYLMGVGRPEDLVEGIYRGIDMFDCVLATRLGRHGVAFSSFGDKKMTREDLRHTKDPIPMKPGYETHVSKNYSMGYIRHLFDVQETLGQMLLSEHNIEFLHHITRHARQAIIDGTFHEWRTTFYEEYEMKK